MSQAAQGTGVQGRVPAPPVSRQRGDLLPDCCWHHLVWYLPGHCPCQPVLMHPWGWGAPKCLVWSGISPAEPGPAVTSVPESATPACGRMGVMQTSQMAGLSMPCLLSEAMAGCDKTYVGESCDAGVPSQQ